MEFVERYFAHKKHSDAFQVLSDKTCNDLDFEEFFMFLDRTSSRVGQQCLYHRLRAIPHPDPAQEAKENLIREFSQNEALRLDTQLQLHKLEGDDVYFIPSLFQEEHQAPPQWFPVVKLLAFTSLLLLLLMPFNPQLLLAFGAVYIANIGVHYWNKRNLYHYLGSIPQLLRLSAVAEYLYQNPALQFLDKDLPGAIQVIKRVRNRMSFFRLETGMQSDIGAALWGATELLKIAFLVEPLLLFGVLKNLDTKRKELEQLFLFVGEIDVLISIASLRNGLEHYCLPELTGTKLEAKRVYHPLIEGCVENTIALSDKSVLLTGSNMSGKTSFIRTIGLNAISGMALNTCFAEAMAMPRLQIASAIRISDDLLNDKSYYFEEVLRIKQMIEKSREEAPCLFLLDEIFKGTNTVERISAGKAVLSALAKNRNVVFVATHDIELTELLQDEYELYHFSEVVNDKNVDFDYKLKSGRLTTRNAIRILQINDYPEDLVKEAVALSKRLDEER